MCKFLFNRFTVGLWMFAITGECLADPVTAFVAANAATIQTVGAIASFVGVLSQAGAASNASKYNAQLAEQNAVTSRQQAAASAETADREARQRIGAMEANYGASGISLSEGSPIDILRQSATAAEMDRQNILYGGEVRASGYGNTATLDRYNASASQTSGYLRAGGELLGGFGRSQSLTRV